MSLPYPALATSDYAIEPYSADHYMGGFGGGNFGGFGFSGFDGGGFGGSGFGGFGFSVFNGGEFGHPGGGPPVIGFPGFHCPIDPGHWGPGPCPHPGDDDDVDGDTDGHCCPCPCPCPCPEPGPTPEVPTALELGGGGWDLPTRVLSIALQSGPILYYPVTAEGRLISDATYLSPDGVLTLRIPAGTLVLNQDGTPTYLNTDPDIYSASAPGEIAPEGYTLIAAYRVNPHFTTFSNAVTLEINYNPAALPEGSQPIIAFRSEGSNAWTNLETTGFLAAENGEIPHMSACRISNFSYFALLVKK